MYIAFAIALLTSSSCSAPEQENAAVEGVDEKVLVAEEDNTDLNKASSIAKQPGEVQDEGHIRRVADVMPVFPGGEGALMAYLKKNIRYPKGAVEDGVEGMVFTSFVVDEEGRISDIQVLKSPDERLSKAAIETIGAMPAWQSGEHQGEKVSVRYNLPVFYRLKDVAEGTVTKDDPSNNADK